MGNPTALAVDEETLSDLRREAERAHVSVPEYIRNLSALRKSARAFDLPVHVGGAGAPSPGGLMGGVNVQNYLDQAMQIALLRGLGIMTPQGQQAAPAPEKKTLADSITPFIEVSTQLALIKQLPKMLSMNEEEDSPLRRAIEQRAKDLEAQVLKSAQLAESADKRLDEFVNETEKKELRNEADREKKAAAAERAALMEQIRDLAGRVENLQQDRNAPPPTLATQMQEMAAQAQSIQQGITALRDIFPHPKTVGEEDNSGFGKAMKILNGVNEAAASFAETYGRMQGNRAAGGQAGAAPPPPASASQGIPPGTLPPNYAPEPPPRGAPTPRQPAPGPEPAPNEVYVDPNTDEIVTADEYQRRYPGAPANEPQVPPGALGETQVAGEDGQAVE